MDTSDKVYVLRNYYKKIKDKQCYVKFYDDIKSNNNLNFKIEDVLNIMFEKINHEAFSVLWISLNEQTTQRTFVVYNMIYDILKNRIDFELYYDNEKDIIEKETINEPLIICGMPRVGSTFLHELLSLDNNNRTIRGWETTNPFPPAETDEDIEYKKLLSKPGFELVNENIPNIKAMHYVNEQTCQECIEWLAYDFTSLKFCTVFSIPKYSKWLLECNDFYSVIDLFERILKFFQYKNKKTRWVLKSPAHMLHFKYLLEKFPDLKLINLYRDPVISTASAFSLCSTVSKYFNATLKNIDVSDDMLIFFSVLYNRFINDISDIIKSDRYIDIDYNEFILDPLDTIIKLYNYFDYDFSESFKQKIDKYINKKSLKQIHSKYGKHVYDLNTFNLKPIDIKKKFKVWYDLHGK